MIYINNIKVYIRNPEEFFASLDLVTLSEVENKHDLISTFRCSKNLDLEEYLSQKAIDSDERGNARTHLLINNHLSTPEIVGYFTLTDGISKEMMKKIDGCSGFFLKGMQ